jgi:hypothetical protein
MLSSYLPPGPPSGLFTSYPPIKMLYEFIICPMRATYHVHRIPLPYGLDTLHLPTKFGYFTFRSKAKALSILPSVITPSLASMHINAKYSY